MVGFWATLALNIPDFTRFARTQRDQLVGQSVGLPVPMGLLAALAVIVTSATVVLYGKAIWDPVDLASRMTGVAVLVALIILLIDTVSVNLAANLVGPAYDFSALAPKQISYRAGGYITASIAMVTRVSEMLDADQQRDEHASLAKAYTTSRMRETVAWCREIFGGNGIITDYTVARHFADAEAIYSYEGTREMNTLIVGRAITVVMVRHMTLFDRSVFRAGFALGVLFTVFAGDFW
eukprot:gene48870-59843_t